MKQTYPATRLGGEMIFSENSPRDDLSITIRNFLLDAIARNGDSFENLEIEAKFGLIIDRGTNGRIKLPVFSECAIDHEGWTTFVTDMPLNLHKSFNEALNKRCADRSLGWKYLHTKTLDHILPNKTRVTLDAATGAMINAQFKKNLGHLTIYQPNCDVDIRISINVEVPVPLESVQNVDLSHPGILKRKKDRLAYELAKGLLSVDLTQVTQNDSGAHQIKHELELEVKDPNKLMNSDEAFQNFVDSIRELSQLTRY